MRILLQIGLIAVVAACGSHVESGALSPAPGPVSASPVFLNACASGARPQAELDFAGLPPLVPTSPSLRCLLNAVSGATSYDGGYDFVIQLSDRRVLHIYERRGSRPVKDGTSPSLRMGDRDVNGTKWEWATLANGATMLATTSAVSTRSSLSPGMTRRSTPSLRSRAVSVRSRHSLDRARAISARR
jgi:hypothetical protein